MDWADYLRDQATMYLQLAEQADDPAVQNEMLELASVCEEVAKTARSGRRGRRFKSYHSDHLSSWRICLFSLTLSRLTTATRPR